MGRNEKQKKFEKFEFVLFFVSLVNLASYGQKTELINVTLTLLNMLNPESIY